MTDEGEEVVYNRKRFSGNTHIDLNFGINKYGPGHLAGFNNLFFNGFPGLNKERIKLREEAERRKRRDVEMENDPASVSQALYQRLIKLLNSVYPSIEQQEDFWNYYKERLLLQEQLNCRFSARSQGYISSASERK